MSGSLIFSFAHTNADGALYDAPPGAIVELACCASPLFGASTRAGVGLVAGAGGTDAGAGVVAGGGVDGALLDAAQPLRLVAATSSLPH